MLPNTCCTELLRDLPDNGTVAIINDPQGQCTLQMLTMLAKRITSSHILVVDPFVSDELLHFCDKVRDHCLRVGMSTCTAFRALYVVQNNRLSGLAAALPSYTVRVLILHQQSDLDTLIEDIYEWWQCLMVKGKMLVQVKNPEDLATKQALLKTFGRQPEYRDGPFGIYTKTQHFRVPQRS